jgi:hypothetical protein
MKRHEVVIFLKLISFTILSLILFFTFAHDAHVFGAFGGGTVADQLLDDEEFDDAPPPPRDELLEYGEELPE